MFCLSQYFDENNGQPYLYLIWWISKWPETHIFLFQHWLSTIQTFYCTGGHWPAGLTVRPANFCRLKLFGTKNSLQQLILALASTGSSGDIELQKAHKLGRCTLILFYKRHTRSLFLQSWPSLVTNQDHPVRFGCILLVLLFCWSPIIDTRPGYPC